MRRHTMMAMLELAARMVERDDGVELVAQLEGWRFGPGPHLRARRAREQHARGLSRAPEVQAPGLRLGDDVDRVWEVLAASVGADAS